MVIAIRKYFCVLVLIGLTIIMTPLSNYSSIAGFYQVTDNQTSKLEWMPFKSNHELEINSSGLENNPIFLLSGRSGDQNEGFIAYNKYKGNFIVISSGLMNKTNIKNPEYDSQFTISFKIVGKNNNYTLSLVNGRASEHGWHNLTFYEPFQENSSKIINLPRLIESVKDNYLLIDKIILGLEKNTRVDEIQINFNFVANELPESRANVSSALS